MSSSSAYEVNVTLSPKFNVLPPPLRMHMEANHKAAPVAFFNDAESGTVNSLKERYAVMCIRIRSRHNIDHHNSPSGKTLGPTKTNIVLDNIPTVSGANIALLEHFMAKHGDQIVQGAGVPAITRHTGEILRPAVVPGSNFVALKNVSAPRQRNQHPEKGQIGWVFLTGDHEGGLFLSFTVVEKVDNWMEEIEMQVWVERVGAQVEEM
jgi:hypothetical protein